MFHRNFRTEPENRDGRGKKREKMDMNYSGGMREGGGGQDGVEWGGEWDNCNSIINKYIINK